MTFGPGERVARGRSTDIMDHRTECRPVDVAVTTHGELPGAADYARDKIGRLVRFTHQPVLHARVKLSKHQDPAVPRPVVAQGNLDVNGRQLRAQVQAETAREAVDRLETRLRRRLQRITEHGQARHAGAAAPAHLRPWRHQSEPTPRPGFFPRPADQRRVIRRKSFAMKPSTVDEAALEMELLDYDFHLFTESATGAASVLYRSGDTGYRLALLTPDLAAQLAPFELPVTISRQPVPCLTEDQAIERIALLNVPFLFFIDAAYGRANVLYHRYDGHYGLITPSG